MSPFIAWLMRFLGIVAPAMPLVRWPLAARLVPPVQELAAGLYQASFMLGVGQGLSLGLTLGLVLGVLAATFVFGFVYWSFFKPVRESR